MISMVRVVIVVCVTVLFAGCAHSIRIAPDSDKLPQSVVGAPIAKNVGYFISEEARVRRITTGGGGGDKVEYAPYGDLEVGIFRVLSNVFKDVHLLKSVDDQAVIASKGIVLVFRPLISTDSSSNSMLTWPPTDFTVTIAMEALDQKGKVVWSDTVTGVGKAEFSEFRADHALSGKRASAAALSALQERLLAAPALR